MKNVVKFNNENIFSLLTLIKNVYGGKDAV